MIHLPQPLVRCCSCIDNEDVDAAVVLLDMNNNFIENNIAMAVVLPH